MPDTPHDAPDLRAPGRIAAASGSETAVNSPLISDTAVGTVVGLAVRGARRAPMIMTRQLVITPAGSVTAHIETSGEGTTGAIITDHKGQRLAERALTILSHEAWQQACARLAETTDQPKPASAVLPWTARRANVLIEGLTLPYVRGARVQFTHADGRPGPLTELTRPTTPCTRMDEAAAGLRRALGRSEDAPAGRGGITVRILEGGTISLGDRIAVTYAPPHSQRRLP